MCAYLPALLTGAWAPATIRLVQVVDRISPPTCQDPTLCAASVEH